MKYKVGDKVTIRKWEAMVEEFGLDEKGGIKTPISNFVQDMKSFCGRQLEITNVHSGYSPTKEKTHVFTDDMIEHNFTYGEEIECSDIGVNWKKDIFKAYVDGGVNFPYFCKNSNYRYARKIEKPSIEITVKMNGKECKLSDISEETLLKLRNM